MKSILYYECEARDLLQIISGVIPEKLKEALRLAS